MWRCLCFAWLTMQMCCHGFRPQPAVARQKTALLAVVSPIDDKQIVKEYFENEGFRRWSKIYSHSSEISAVQRDIRSGHEETIRKVLNWLVVEDNGEETLCDLGCGVGSLCIPASPLFQQVHAADISSSMITEASQRAHSDHISNVHFEVSDLEKVSGEYDTVTCIDVIIHYPAEQMLHMIAKIASLAKHRLILSFAPKTLCFDMLKRVGELFPGSSKATRAHLHREADIIQALKQAGFTVRRKEMTSKSFYFSRLLEAVRD